MEGKHRLLQILAFCTGPAIDVVQHYFEVKIIQQFRDFEQFLNDPQNKHKLFHEHYPKIPCCDCTPISIAAPCKRGCLGYQQFSKLYDDNGPVTAGHEKIKGSHISQHCLCKVSAQKTVKITDIDITLLNAIIQHCCPLHITSKISRWMTDIKEVRNTFSHWAEGKLDKNVFDQTWKKLETATLEFAGDIGHSCVKIFKMAIDQISTCSVAVLRESILKTTDNLSEVRVDLNGVIPIVRSILSNQNAVIDKISTHSKDVTEVKTGVSGIKTDVAGVKSGVAGIKTDVAGVNTAVSGVDTKVGDVNHRLINLEFMVGLLLKRQGENPGVDDMVLDEKKRKVTIDVDASSSTWDEERTTCNLAVAIQTVQNDNDNDNKEEFQLEKVENRCIHLELSASPELFQSPLNLRKAIKSLIRQFVKAGELDENVPSTVYINITVKSELTIEEKNVVYKVFSANDTLDGLDNRDALQIDQKPGLLVKATTVEPDHGIGSSSKSEILYNRDNTKRLTGVDVKKERQEDAIEIVSIHLENVTVNMRIKGRPQSLLKSSDAESEINIQGSSDFSVIWTWYYAQKKRSWDVLSVVETINRRISNLRDWFHVNYAYVDKSGRLALQTTTASHTFSSLPSIEMAVKSFLGKFIEICDLRKYLGEEQLIDIDVTRQHTDDKDANAEKINSGDTILTCVDCKKHLICLVCRTNTNLIAKLNYKLQVQRETIMDFEDDTKSMEAEEEDLDLEDKALKKIKMSTATTDESADTDALVLRKRKKQTKISTDLQEKDNEDKALKKIKMSTATTDESTDTELQGYVIDKEKALQKLGEIPLIDMKIRQIQQEMRTMLRNTRYKNIIRDCIISDLRGQRKQRSGIVETLAEIVTTNKNKLVTQEDKRFLEDLDFLNVDLESSSNKCQQCSSQGCGIMTCICTYCKLFLCDDCIREHRKEFPDHVFVFRENITRGFEYEGEILIDCSEELDLSKFDVFHVMDMKSIKGMVVIIMYMNRNCFLRVYSAVMGTQNEFQSQTRLELDQKKSQMTIIDENTVAITVPCKSHILIVNLKTDLITTINVMTMMTGAIAFIDKNLYVASRRHIRTMNLQGEILANIGLPDIQMLHPLRYTKLYCVSSNPQKHISYIDMTDKEEHTLLEFPFHPECLTSDELGDIYFISNRVLWKAKHDGEESIVVLSNLGGNTNAFLPETICFDISKQLLLVQTSCTEIKIYRKN